MNLVIDVGNTRFKYAFLKEGMLLRAGYEPEVMFQELEEWSRQETVYGFLSGSGKINDSWRQRLKKGTAFLWEAGRHLALPLSIGYDTPETLGFDRIAICAGARMLFPGKNLLVIDSGTAITYNYVSMEGVFEGGNIAPGQEIRFRSLHLFTEQLPYVEGAEGEYGFGKNTADAILFGVMKGVVLEVKGYVEEFCRKYAQRQVVVTGGNSLFLKEKLGTEVCFEKNLGFLGLNEILEYNKNYN